jgi:hypothetical protein
MHKQTATTISQSDLEEAVLRVLAQQLGAVQPALPAGTDRNTGADAEYSTMRGVTQRFGLSRSRQYDLLGTGEIEAVKSGDRTIVVIASVRRYLARCPRAAIAPPRRRKLLQPAPVLAPAASDTKRVGRRRIRQAGEGAGVPTPA